MRRALLVAPLLAVTACSGGGSPSVAPTAAPTVSPPAATAPAGGVVGVLDGVQLQLEVADTPEERAVGLMGRTSVPAGTGMVFLYDAPSNGAFYMFRVPIPLRATFIRQGRVVSTVVMPPCPEPVASDCPTYGADGEFDTVVETDPAVAPRPEPGDAFDLRG